MKDEIRKLEEVIESVRGEIEGWRGMGKHRIERKYTGIDEALEVLSKIQQDLLQARDRLKHYNQ